MKAEPPIPSREQLHEAKFLEDQLQNLINLAATQENQSPADRQKMEQLFRNYRRLHNKLMEAARRLEETDPLIEALELRRKPILAQMQQRASTASGPLSPSPASASPPLAESPGPPSQPEAVEPLEDAVPPTELSHNLGPLGRPGVISSGPEVELLQHILAGLGFPVSPSGEFDAPTLKAVRNFQLKAKLTITGVVDARSRELLNRRLPSGTSSPSSPSAISNAATPAKVQENTQIDSDNSPIEPPRPVAEVPPTETLIHDLGQQSSGKLAEGPEVLLLQKALQRVGFEPELNGKFELRTFSAVRKFQARHKMPVNGWVGAPERMLLNPVVQEGVIEEKLLNQQSTQLKAMAEQEGMSLDPPREKLSLRWSALLLKQLLAAPPLDTPPDLPPLPPLQMPTLEHELGTPGQQGIISQGPEVLLLQELLLEQGEALKITEHFDLQTYTALRHYQEKHGLPPTGMADTATRAQLKPFVLQRQAQAQLKHQLYQIWQEACGAFQRECPPPLQTALLEHCEKMAQLLYLSPEKLQAWQRASLPEALVSDLAPPGRPGKISSGDEVLLLQYLLRQKGVDLEETGCFDSATAAAVRAFQRGQKLPLTGEVDARVRALLNQSPESPSNAS